MFDIRTMTERLDQSTVEARRVYPDFGAFCRAAL